MNHFEARLPVISRKEAEAIFESLIHDQVALKAELAFAKTIESSDNMKAQYLDFAAAVFMALEEFAGCGLSLFAEEPKLRLSGVDIDNPDSLRAARRRLEAAALLLSRK